MLRLACLSLAKVGLTRRQGCRRSQGGSWADWFFTAPRQERKILRPLVADGTRIDMHASLPGAPLERRRKLCAGVWCSRRRQPVRREACGEIGLVVFPAGAASNGSENGDGRWALDTREPH